MTTIEVWTGRSWEPVDLARLEPGYSYTIRVRNTNLVDRWDPPATRQHPTEKK